MFGMPNNRVAARRGSLLRFLQAAAGLGGGLLALIGVLTALMGASRGADLAPSAWVLGIGLAVLLAGVVLTRLRRQQRA